MIKRWWWIPLLAILVCVPVGVMVAAFVVYLAPKKFEAEAVIEIKQPHMVGLPSDPPPVRKDFGEDLSTQITLLDGPAFAGDVVERLDLQRRWAADERNARRNLEEAVTAERIPGTDLVRVKAWSTDPSESAEIVAAVVAAYGEKRKDAQVSALVKPLAEMEAALRKQEEQVEIERANFKSVGVADEQSRIDAKRRLDTEIELLQSMKLTFVRNKVTRDLLVDDSSMIVHEEPRAPLAPTSSGMANFFVMGGIAGLVVSVLVGVFLMFVCEKVRKSRSGVVAV